MDRIRVLLVDAFTDEPFAGNTAGVVPDAGALSSSQMGAIACELGASDTVFFARGKTTDRRARFFTPATEVALCGHATVAGYAHLADAGAVDVGSHALETNKGTVEVEVDADGTVWLDAGAPGVRTVEVDIYRVGEAIGIDSAALDVDGLPIARASAGLPYLVVPVQLLEHLGRADPDPAAVEALCSAVDAVGVYAFTFDTLTAEATLHGRMWEPAGGIPEDPVTGTASAAVGEYLQRFGALDPVPGELAFEQGHFVDRPGLVRVRLGEHVRIGGRAATALDGELRLPPVDEDDGILEA